MAERDPRCRNGSWSGPKAASHGRSSASNSSWTTCRPSSSAILYVNAGLVFSLASCAVSEGSAWTFFVQRLLYVRRNIDDVFVGRFIGAAALGAYSASLQRSAHAFFTYQRPDAAGLVCGVRTHAGRSRVDLAQVGPHGPAPSAPSASGAPRPDGGVTPVRSVILGDRSHVYAAIRAPAGVGVGRSAAVCSGRSTATSSGPAEPNAVAAINIDPDVRRPYQVAIGLHWGVVSVASGYAI